MDYVDDLHVTGFSKMLLLFLYPSRYDGFGKPPLEAAIVKTPILVNDVPVMHEITRNAAIYVDFYGNQNQLFDAIGKELEKQDLNRAERLYSIAASYTWENLQRRL